MVDIHCHILPGVDDGAESIDESLAMLRKMMDAGVETVVATPHFLRGLYEIDSAERRQMTVDLQKAADENGIKIQIISGVEYYLAPQILEDLDNLAEFTIDDNGKYILVDLPMNTMPPSMEEICFRLKMKDIVPILAHPERNARICRNPNIVFDIVMQGCIIQVNAGSILGQFGRGSRRVVRELMAHGLTHIVASDMHSPGSFTLDQAVPVVERLMGKERTTLMFVDNPRQAITGGAIYQAEIPQRIGEQRSGLRRFFSKVTKVNKVS